MSDPRNDNPVSIERFFARISRDLDPALRLPNDAVVRVGGYPPALQARWAEIRQRGGPQVGIADRLPAGAFWAVVRDAREGTRLLVFARTTLLDFHLDQAVFFFLDDEFKQPNSTDRRLLFGFEDARVEIRSDTGHELLPGDASYKSWLPMRDQAKRLLAAVPDGSITIPEIGKIVLVQCDWLFGF